MNAQQWRSLRRIQLVNRVLNGACWPVAIAYGIVGSAQALFGHPILGAVSLTFGLVLACLFAYISIPLPVRVPDGPPDA